jgi:EH domain-containing protein 1
MEVLAVRPVKQDEQTYKRWFDYADTDNDGRLTGPDVVKLFALSQLPRGHLKQVWAVADSKRQGFLGFKEFVAAMQMISLAQASGKDVSADMLSTCGNL